MISKAVSWTRDYLAARDLSEVASGLAVGQRDGEGVPSKTGYMDVDHLSSRPLVLERLPSPLPADVHRVAKLSLIVFGTLCGAGALFEIGGGISVVLMPIIMGREGVGTAMITLFAVCVTFVITGILLLAARSAARVIRRERRGVRSLSSFAILSAVVLAIAGGITEWLGVAFFATENGVQTAFNWSTPLLVVELLGVALFAWVALVLRRYEREFGR